jgi:hypothetical protein
MAKAVLKTDAVTLTLGSHFVNVNIDEKRPFNGGPEEIIHMISNDMPAIQDSWVAWTGCITLSAPSLLIMKGKSLLDRGTESAIM